MWSRPLAHHPLLRPMRQRALLPVRTIEEFTPVASSICRTTIEKQWYSCFYVADSVPEREVAWTGGSQSSVCLRINSAADYSGDGQAPIPETEIQKKWVPTRIGPFIQNFQQFWTGVHGPHFDKRWSMEGNMNCDLGFCTKAIQSCMSHTASPNSSTLMHATEVY